MSEILDATGFVKCPYCGCPEKMRYTVIPPCERTFQTARADGVTNEFWHVSRDYKCGNCDFEFSTLMRPEDYA